MKECRCCREVKPLDEFHLCRRRGREERQGYCKPCAIRRAREWRAANPEKRKAHTRWQTHRLTNGDWQALWVRQAGVCLLCHRPETDGVRFVVDHDHACCPTKKTCGGCIRGLLHVSCNSSLGVFGDSVTGLQAAIDYLTTYN